MIGLYVFQQFLQTKLSVNIQPDNNIITKLLRNTDSCYMKHGSCLHIKKIFGDD